MPPKKQLTEVNMHELSSELAHKRKAEFEADGAAKPKEPKVEESSAATPAVVFDESEKDATPDARPKLQTSVSIEAGDMSLNVVPTLGGRLLTALTDSGLQYLLAGARANVAVKAGRYYFEARIVELMNHADPSRTARTPAPKQSVRIGFSTAGSTLFLGETEDSVCFDAEGFFMAEKKRTAASERFSRDQTVAVLLNLDQNSSNANTVSLFRDGLRVSTPQPIPEGLRGKALCPHVTYRNVSLQINFGPESSIPLPFKCHMVQQAASADVDVVPPPPTADGKFDVIFPVGLPDEGLFDWLDIFLEKNPHYVELSDRKIIDWVQKSGLWKSKAANYTASKDRPDTNFGVPTVDDMSARKILQTVAPLVPRNYVVMEVRGNLLESERTSALRRFGAPHFRRVAKVMIGEPDADYKNWVHSTLLGEKQEQVEKDWKAKKVERERAKQIELRKKQIMESRAALEAKKKADQDGVDADQEGEETKNEFADDQADEKEDDEQAPRADLSEKEQQQFYRTHTTPDLAPQALTTSFAHFSIPEMDEGFTQISFEWQDSTSSTAYLKDWVLHRKKTTRVEDLQPSDWFYTRLNDWQKTSAVWQAKQKEYKQTPQKDGDAGAKATVNDIFSVSDVCDLGDGEPLFANFSYEDWTLMTLRFELHLVMKAFTKDVDDDDRPGIPEPHLFFYYNKYYRKQLNIKMFGVSSVAELLELIKDTARIDPETQILVPQLTPEQDTDSFDIFPKLTEEARRDRQRRIDAGDETAKLKLAVIAPPVQTPQVVPTRVVPPPAQPGRNFQASWQQGSGAAGGAGRGSWQSGGARPAWSGQGIRPAQRPSWSSTPQYAPKSQSWR